jgi:hypothetical protein
LVLCLAGGPLALATGCAATTHHPVHTWTMNTNPKLPAAEGQVKIQVDGVGDHIVELSFQRLETAPTAFEGTTMYMVWLVPDNAPPQPIGSLDVGDDLKAKVTIKTPNERFEVLVTAEVDAYVTAPSRNRAFDVTIRSA